MNTFISNVLANCTHTLEFSSINHLDCEANIANGAYKLKVFYECVT